MVAVAYRRVWGKGTWRAQGLLDLSQADMPKKRDSIKATLLPYRSYAGVRRRAAGLAGVLALLRNPRARLS